MDYSSKRRSITHTGTSTGNRDSSVRSVAAAVAAAPLTRKRLLVFVLVLTGVVLQPVLMLLHVLWQHNNSAFSAYHQALLDSSAITSLLSARTTTATATTTTTTSSDSVSSASALALALPALVPNSTATIDSDAARSRHGLDADQLGEPLHLGGRLDYDTRVISPQLFQLLRRDWGIRSLLDIGCGRGWTTLWFYLQGVYTRCVEASPSARKRNLLPNSTIVNHDFTRGPWWPEEAEQRTFDLVWSTRFVQQVSRPYMRNYLKAMSRAAILLVSFPREPGWHHVEVHDSSWWIVQFELHGGFRYSQELTLQVRQVLETEIKEKNPPLGPDGTRFAPTELLNTVLVFLNPTVASLPAHAHLLSEFGCYKGQDKNDNNNNHNNNNNNKNHENEQAKLILRECNTGNGLHQESPLGSDYAPPKIDAIQHKVWEAAVRKHLNNNMEQRPSDKLWESILRHRMSSDGADGGDGGGDGGGDEPRTTTASQQPTNISHHAVMHIPQYILAKKKRGNHKNRSSTTTITTSSIPKIPVVVWPLVEFGALTAEALHIETNGIQESPLLQLSDDIYNFDPHVVWIGDTGYAYGWDYWCGKFHEQVANARSIRISLGLPSSWPIYIVDWSDYQTRQRCYDVEKTVGREFVFYTKRGMVQKRDWNAKKGWVDQGELLPLEIEEFPGIQYRHTPLIVRTDIVESLQSSLRKRGLTLRDKIEAFDRPIDVTHLWPLNPTDPSSGVGGLYGELRTRVSEIVLDLANNTKDLVVYVGVAGATSYAGRREVHSTYIKTMLKTKIMIVTQRDPWEDHYRLFEALISGAMVMADRMLSLPAGLKNGTSIVEFGSEAELRSLVVYYLKHADERLAIAHKGRHVSMSRHRTWHRMEEIIFGRALTLCSSSDDDDDDHDDPATGAASSGCPYIVHANETTPQ